MLLAEPVLFGRTSPLTMPSLTLARPLPLFLGPFVVLWCPGPQATLPEVCLRLGTSLACSLAPAAPDLVTRCRLEAAPGHGTVLPRVLSHWLPGRGGNASLHPGLAPWPICSWKGLVAPWGCPMRAEGSCGLPAKGSARRPSGLGRTQGWDRGRLRKKALGVLSNRSLFAERSSDSGALKSQNAWQVLCCDEPGRIK